MKCPIGGAVSAPQQLQLGREQTNSGTAARSTETNLLESETLLRSENLVSFASLNTSVEPLPAERSATEIDLRVWKD